MPLEKFAWVVPDKLAGCKFPQGEDTFADIASTKKIKTLITLTETSHPDTSKLYKGFGVDTFHIAISDFSPPSDAQIEQFCDLILNAARQPVLIHCHLGAGRTGTMLAIGAAAFWYSGDPFVRGNLGGGLTADAVLALAKKMRPQSILTTRQERFVRELLCDAERCARLLVVGGAGGAGGGRKQQQQQQQQLASKQ